MALFGEEHLAEHDDEVDVDVDQSLSGSEAGYQDVPGAPSLQHSQKHQMQPGTQEHAQQEEEAEAQRERPFRIEPISGATLYELERNRVEDARRRGVLSTGCKEVDEQVLLGGGFERGTVVGVSCEDAEFGISVSIQTLARSLVLNMSSRAAIITTLPASAVLGPLRSAVSTQINQRHAGQDEISTLSKQEAHMELRSCLERASISRVFDVVGLWQVLDELEASSRMSGKRDNEEREMDKTKEASTRDEAWKVNARKEQKEVPATSLPSLRPEVPRVEVADSEDEDDDEALSSPEPVDKSTEEHPPKQQTPPPDEDHHVQEQGQTQALAGGTTTSNSGMPDMILVTHFSTLLSELFTQSGHDRSAAHTTLQLLSSHLRYLARSLGSVVMLLNTTTSYVAPTGSTNTNGPAAHEVQRDTPPAAETPPQQRPSSSKPIDPTLRSIFNPAPMPNGTNASASAAGNLLSKKNKPTFGLTFTQFLDVHLLCTRIPRTKDDAEHIYAAASRGENGTSSTEELKARFSSRYCWIVEVLLDELGVWLKSSPGSTKLRREGREQRWGAVQIRPVDGVVEDALGGVDGAEQRRLAELMGQGSFRLAAGFGGRRV